MGRSCVLLTGRNGFTGRYVAAELEAAGYDVVGLSDRPEPGGARSINANLLDREAVAAAVVAVKPDVVLHLAAISFVAHGDVSEIYEVNVVGTRNLLEALTALEKKPRIVVLASSANVYGNAEVEPITEETPPAPANDYAVSKLAMEYMARLWTDKLPIVITRPFNYTGVGQSEQFLIPKIIDHFRRGKRVIELGNTEVVREFGDVRDVARAYASIVKTQPLDLTQKLFELLFGRASVRAFQRDAFAHLAGQPGDADHEELVEVAGRDRQEAHALQQRVMLVVRFLQHTPVELQPGKLAVDETVRIAALGACLLDGREFAAPRLQFIHVATLEVPCPPGVATAYGRSFSA